MAKELVDMRHRRMSLRPVHSIKHVVDFQTAVPANTQITQLLVNVVDAPTLGVDAAVETGATINSFYITTEVVASETSTTDTPNFYWILFKNPGSNVGTIPNGNAVGSSDFKRNVIHQEMVMLNPVDGGSPRNVFKGVIKIPRHMKRCGPNDQWFIQLFIPSTGTAVNCCTQCHYKEYR